MYLSDIAEIIAAQLPIKKESITLNTRLVEDLRADSANIMMMIMDLEDRFGIEVEDGALAEMKTVGDVVTYLEQHVK